MAMCSSDRTNPRIEEQLRCRKPRNSTSDPNPEQIASIMQSTRCKPAISPLLLSNKYIKGSSFLGFGCTAQPEVSVPGVIRSSAVWEQRGERDKKTDSKKKNKKKNKKKKQDEFVGVMMNQESVVQDLWCGLDSAASVDSVRPLPSRIKIDREHVSYSSRQRVHPGQFGGLDLDSAFDASHIRPDVFGTRHYHHLRNRSPEVLSEILMFQNGLLLSRRSGSQDRYRDWRLDVDSMTYEELLELGERIGHVNTGLGEDQIGKCLRKAKISGIHKLSSQSYVSQVEPKCSICQEEYEAEDEMGKLECGHAYHLHCIKQWLARKNVCPVCKAEASSQ